MIRLIENLTPSSEATKLLGQLHSEFTPEHICESIQAQQQEYNYQLIGNFNPDEELLGVAGFVCRHSLALGNYLLIEDLVIAKSLNSSEAGSKLMRWMRNYAADHDCQQLHINSVVKDYALHKLFLQEGFRISSHHFSFRLLPGS